MPRFTLAVSGEGSFSGHTTAKISPRQFPRKLKRTDQRSSCMQARFAAPAAQAGYDLSNIDLERLYRSARVTNIVLNCVQHLVNMTAQHQLAQGQTEPHGHFRHHMRRQGKRIRIGHHIN